MNDLKEEDIKKKLTPEEYSVLREHGTEAPFSGALLKEKSKGVYKCKVCGNVLFSSDTKFDSGTGWPSFVDIMSNNTIKTSHDDRYGMDRVEVSCANCNSHLGHVFDDGPSSTGKRYCINSVCLEFQKENEK